MPVIKEFECDAHGYFDAAEPTCPHGCHVSMVQRVFLTAPAFQSQGYRNMNGTIETLAREHGLSNIDQRGGDGQRRMDWQGRKRIGQATEMLITHAKNEANRGRDAGDYFRPLGSGTMPSMPGVNMASAQGVLAKSDTRTVTDRDGKTRSYGTGNTVVPGLGLEFGPPKIASGTPSFDGRSLGVPKADAP